MIRTGLIGYGLGGCAFHAPLIDAVPELALTAIVTSRADAVRARYPQTKVVSEAAALFVDPQIELVVVSTPNDTHFPLAHAALEAGKHVVIDKPFANSVAEAEALVTLAEAQGTVLSVFHNRRWDSDFLTVRKLLDDRAVGEVALYEARWDRFRPALRDSWHEIAGPGGGVLIDLGPHLIDQALALFGPPQTLTADIIAQRAGSRVDDYFEITLHYGRMRAVLSSAAIVPAPRARFAVHGTRGSFVKYGLDPQEAQLRAGARADAPGLGVEEATQHGALIGGDGASQIVPSETGDYRRFYAGIAHAIADRAPPPVSPEDALAVLRIVELARQSAAEGRSLPFQ
ncbi:scyllo-inositol 2-dehydrogenase (NADP+) [Sphingomonas naasensis]|uniref:Oxidoreductase n=1 Tax=Sphingomonas naasensis TaxID=1344951 RepID=A0A4S1WS55_9SPHN|nr:oxidoreductase [Sphingomonas naasensis]NIJ19038.1 scyllo-inositol 2-dehydrogenase (NADP+) [Sphingomonas naasensis]TGX46239.1 oxidoreductase [Sphingomonas naasensis]